MDLRRLFMDSISISSIVNAVATIVIAVYAWRNYVLVNKLNQEQIDLYKAIVIATIIDSDKLEDKVKVKIENFNKHYKGQTKIFLEDKKIASG